MKQSSTRLLGIANISFSTKIIASFKMNLNFHFYTCGFPCWLIHMLDSPSFVELQGLVQCRHYVLKDWGSFCARGRKKCVCPRQHSERVWRPRPRNHWTPGDRTPAWRGFGLMLITNIHSTSWPRKHGAMSPLPLTFWRRIAQLNSSRTFIRFPLITDNSSTLRTFLFFLVLTLKNTFLIQLSTY